MFWSFAKKSSEESDLLVVLENQRQKAKFVICNCKLKLIFLHEHRFSPPFICVQELVFDVLSGIQSSIPVMKFNG